MLSFEEALARLLAAAPAVAEVEALSTRHADRRVLAQAQTATVDAPPLDNSAMDGYAVAVADVPRVGTSLPVTQRIPAGSVGSRLRPGSAARIFTGAPIPPGADAVVMQELCEHDAGEVQINHRPQIGEHVRRSGSDIAAGSEILACGQRLRPQDTALAASVGIASLPVFRRLRVAVLCTGNELRMPGETLPPGAIYNANRFLLAALLERLGCVVQDAGAVADTLPAMQVALRAAASDNDLVITSGGVSVGEEDHVRAAVELAGRLEMWKVAMKPGKPLAFGHLATNGREIPFVGLPGNPVSCLVTFVMLVRPLLLRMQGVRQVSPASYRLHADFDWPFPDARREFLRVRSNAGGGVELFGNQGSGVLTSTVWGDGLVDNAPQQVVRRGDAVSFIPFAALLD
ncbi:MAG: molybdopterin molybdotransferase MoeA [Candidatus Accumulibacter sp.]|uniref:molybdopterin molybdotransferase MoeA n=1 Tax=Accumulibacter sp. TaxID=2053492 RepID=UPI001A5FC991|nr:gephyrin-like molybdotransferase Glp [Accumulibacter sp.]MBL8392568.1 molybdopterin molybdotransferase MoeA [Accumulibacter sp.]HRD87570.1 molybdopterin molybdotransferase MoeA [Accumulibacter sp.]